MFAEGIHGLINLVYERCFLPFFLFFSNVSSSESIGLSEWLASWAVSKRNLSPNKSTCCISLQQENILLGCFERLDEWNGCKHPWSLIFRPNISLVWSIKNRPLTIPNYIKFVEHRILRGKHCKIITRICLNRTETNGTLNEKRKEKKALEGKSCWADMCFWSAINPGNYFLTSKVKFIFLQNDVRQKKTRQVYFKSFSSASWLV